MSIIDLPALESAHDDMRIARGIVLDDEGKLLLVRRSLTAKRNRGLWELPGGQVDKDDLDLESAGAREVWEETGEGLITRTLTEMVEVHQEIMQGGDNHGRRKITYVNMAEVVMGDVVLNQEISDFMWVTPEAAERQPDLLAPSLIGLQKHASFLLQHS